MRAIKRIGFDLLVALYFLQLPAVVAYLVISL